MSFKSKNLQFDASQPAFLQRLRGQIQGSLPADRDPDRHLDPSRFGRRQKRLGQEDGEDDEPVYVLDSGESLSKAEYDAREARGEDNEAKEAGKKDADTAEQVNGEVKKGIAEQNRSVKVGVVSKKRKAVKVGGEDGKDGEDGRKVERKSEKKEPAKKKARKKAKVALSFDDEEEG